MVSFMAQLAARVTLIYPAKGVKLAMGTAFGGGGSGRGGGAGCAEFEEDTADGGAGGEAACVSGVVSLDE